jgi:hypothetical protein
MSQQPPPQERRFGTERPGTTGLEPSVRPPARSRQKFKPLPRPTGQKPYRLNLESVLPPDLIAQIKASGRIVFHVGGDTGGVKSPQPQIIVAMKMEEHFNLPNPADRPAFFYNLGDVVYYYGEPDEWYSQFYEPYGHYPAPIFAIPGNHDGDVIGTTPSLAAFVENMCAREPHLTPQSGDVPRDAMTQPNVYWTLEAPFVTIIGLYSNVPEGGQIEDDQKDWFISELKAAPREKALMVAVHHPPYSADARHGGSQYIRAFLDHCFFNAGRMADLVLSGHIHNYQRFNRKMQNGWDVPYIVAGGSGYWHLHYVSDLPNGDDLPVPYPMPGTDVTLMQYADRRHGFLRLVCSNRGVAGEYFTVPRPQESWSAPTERVDYFGVDLVQHRLAP